MSETIKASELLALCETVTQGPWRFVADRDQPGSHFIDNRNGWLVAKAYGAREGVEGGWGDDGLPCHSPQTDATAEYLAAAYPQRLRALVELARAVGAHETIPHAEDCPVCDALRALEAAGVVLDEP